MGSAVGACVGEKLGQPEHVVGATVGGRVGDGVAALTVNVIVPLVLYTVLFPVAQYPAIVTLPLDGIVIEVDEQVHFRGLEQEPPDIVPAVEVKTH